MSYDNSTFNGPPPSFYEPPEPKHEPEDWKHWHVTVDDKSGKTIIDLPFQTEFQAEVCATEIEQCPEKPDMLQFDRDSIYIEVCYKEECCPC